ncbi:universal stress protein [Allosphingosinicella humi]|jgi:nucleotide-binding universal stress UspA family protein
MRSILVATDLGKGAHNALGRACRIAHETRAELHILHATGADTTFENGSAIRRRLHDEAETLIGTPPLVELDLSIRLSQNEPVSAVLKEAARLKPDLIILGAHGEPRFRDVLFGTTASRVSREAGQPVLVVQNDYHSTYARVMAAVEERSADEVLRLACSIASMQALYVVHAYGSATQSLFGYGDLLEDVRADQAAKIEQVLARMYAPESKRPEVHNIVEEGEVISVLMREWDKTRPDLVVIGTHGRHGLARLLHASVAEGVLLGCPSDILVMPPRAA